MPVVGRASAGRWVLRAGLLVAGGRDGRPGRGRRTGSRPGWPAALFGAANGWTDAVFYVLAMEASDPRMAASTYALFMAVTNLSVAGGSLFARLAASLGPPPSLAIGSPS